MASNLSPFLLRDLGENPVWKEIVRRLHNLIELADVRIENPDPFLHGTAVGERRAYRLLINLPETLLNEVEGKSPYGGSGRGSADKNV